MLDRIIMGIIDERRRSPEDRGDLLSMLLMAVDEEPEFGPLRRADDRPPAS